MGGPHSISTRNCLGHASCQTPNGSSCQVWSKLLQPFPNYSGKCRNSANFGSKNSWGALTAFQLETAWVMHHARPPMVLHVKFDQNCCSRFQIIAENVENQRILGRKTHGGAPQSISTRNCFGRASCQTPNGSSFQIWSKLMEPFPNYSGKCWNSANFGSKNSWGDPQRISTRNCFGHATCQTPNGSSCKV